MNSSVSVNSELAASVTKNSTIGFLLFEKDRRNAQPAGTGTLVRVGSACGIITAAHVLECLPRSGEIGIVLFPTGRPVKQSMMIEMSHTSIITIWDGVDGHYPDIGFLRLTNSSIASIEAIGCLFYNLERVRKLALSSPSNRIASFYGAIGVIAEWAADLPGTQPKTRIKNIQGLFLAVKKPNELSRNDSDLFNCKIDYSTHVKAPTSYGGVSGGALWEFEAELDGQSIIAMEKKLRGVAFSESAVINGERRINCQGSNAIDNLILRIKAEWVAKAI